MNRDSLQNNFFNGQDLNILVPLLVWGIIGLILSVLVDVLRNKEKIKRTGGFNLIFFIRDNIVRLIVSLLSVLIGVLFNDELFGIEGNLGGLLAGFFSDKIIEALVKFRNNIDLSKFLTKKI